MCSPLDGHVGSFHIASMGWHSAILQRPDAYLLVSTAGYFQGAAKCIMACLYYSLNLSSNKHLTTPNRLEGLRSSNICYSIQKNDVKLQQKELARLELGMLTLPSTVIQ